MRRQAKWTAGLIIAFAAVLALGCGTTDDPAKTEATPEQASGVTIGVSLLTRTHPFYQDLEQGIREAAEAAGFQVLITAGEFDVARQKDQLHDFVTQKVSAIIVCPCDSRSIGTAIKTANEAGIPVFTADIACLAEDARIISHVASDNIEGGRLAARAIATAINQSGKVAIIDHPEVESVIQRVKGFEEEIANYPDITVVAKLSGHGVKDQAFRTAEDVLQAHPDLAAFFGINDDSALGALAAIEKAGKLGRVQVVGFDAVPEARQAIEAGKIYADVIQQPKMIGRSTIEAVQTYLSGGSVEPIVLIPCDLFTKTVAN